MLTLSKSGIEMYLNCPAQYYFRYISKQPGRMDYARLCGTVVHQMVASFHKKGNAKNPFYYKSVDTAIKAWGFNWWKALNENSELMQNRSEAQDWQFYNIGKGCIQTYWHQMFGKPKPLLIEKQHRARLGSVELLGIFDQVREVAADRIAHWRPDLVDANGNLAQGYLPHIIMDLKTSTHAYDTSRLNADTSLVKMAEYQFPLHEDIQATAYTYLFQQFNNGNLPLGFVFYYVRYGKLMFTFRTPDDYATLERSIEHIVTNLNEESFPKHVGRQCAWCDYVNVCRGERDYLLTTPVTEIDRMFGTAGESSISEVSTDTNFVKPKQLRLKLKSPRVKKTQLPDDPEAQELRPTEKAVVELPFFMESDQTEEE